MAASTGTGGNEPLKDDLDSSTTQTVHRLRANSSILQLKKLLGQCRRPERRETISTG